MEATVVIIFCGIQLVIERMPVRLMSIKKKHIINENRFFYDAKKLSQCSAFQQIKLCLLVAHMHKL